MDIAMYIAILLAFIVGWHWLDQFRDVSRAQARALEAIASALLKRIEWEAACRRSDETQAQQRAALAELEKQRARPSVVDDASLAPAARELLIKVQQRQPTQKPEPPPEAA